eukprot:GFYU01016271.1.p1 GENE.GFYU01016271.1~~GFYU01016271.1.p1  ORF type:complete len:407 (-),score=69.85 GFYU01016271.1:15-1235(-)
MASPQVCTGGAGVSDIVEVPLDTRLDRVDLEQARSGVSNQHGSKSKIVLGMLLVVMAVLCFSGMTVFVKLLTQGGMSPIQVLMVRSVIMWMSAVAYLRYKKYDKSYWGPPEKRKFLLGRGVFGTVSMGGLFYALTMLPLADATVIFYSSPIFTAVLCRVYLNESYTVVDGVASILSLLGVVCVAQPEGLFGSDGHEDPYQSTRLWGTILGLVGAMASACAFASVRMVGKDVNVMVLVNYFGLVASTSSFALWMVTDMSWEIHQPLTGTDVWMLLGTGATGAVGQGLLNQGLQYTPAGLASTMNYFEVVVAFVLQALIFHEDFNWLTITGASLICSCAFRSVLSARLMQAKDEKAVVLNGGSTGRETLLDELLETSSHDVDTRVGQGDDCIVHVAVEGESIELSTLK